MAEKNVSISMIKSFRKWNSGEICGFPADQAKRLVDQGVAIYYKEPKKKKAAEVVPEPPEPEVAEEEVAEEEVAEEEVGEVEIEKRDGKYWIIYGGGREDGGPYTKRDLKKMGYKI